MLAVRSRPPPRGGGAGPPAGGGAAGGGAGPQPALVGCPPVGEAYRRAATGLTLEELQQLQQREREARATADVTDQATAGRPRDERLHRLDEIVDEEDVAHLLAVTVDRDRPTQQRADHEMGDPALVLDAELARPADAAHPEDRGRQA